jgi:ubiquinone/menaquinone biosynthesis C-methylase UbiE
MAGCLCPWWLGYFLVNPVRKLWQDPVKVLGPFVRGGMTVLEPGCGMGFFTLDLARLVGPGGRVVAIDLQEKMLAGLRRRASRAGVLDRVEIRQGKTDSLGIADLAGTVDVALLLYVLHEVPDSSRFLLEIRDALKPEGRLLLIEPPGHVSQEELAASLDAARGVGFEVIDRPHSGRDLAALLARVESPSERRLGAVNAG